MPRRRMIAAVIVVVAAAVAASYALRDWELLPHDFRLSDITGGPR